MIFNGNLIGMTIFHESYNQPLSREYKRITFFENTIINNVWIMNRVLTEEELNDIKIDTIINWDDDTIFLAKFNDLNAGNIEGENGNVTEWLVLRKESQETLYKLLKTLPAEVTNFEDYTIEASKVYDYKIVPVFDSKRGKDLFVDRVAANFSDYYLIDPVDGKTFIFDLNRQSSEISNQTDVTFYDNFTKYQGVVQGKQNFIQGNISAIIAENEDYDNGINQSIYFLKEFREFVNNGRPKLFKLRKGGVYKVMLTNLKDSIVDEGIIGVPYSVSVDYKEIGEVD